MARHQGSFRQHFATEARAFNRLCARVLKNPSVGSVHELRAATRRLRAVLWVLRHSSLEARFKAAEKELKRLGRALGAVRELDVAIRDGRRYGLDASVLVARRRRARRRLRRLLVGKAREKRDCGIEAAFRGTRTMRTADLEPAFKALRRDLSGWRRKKIRGGSDLHRFRIRVKKARYAIEALGVEAEALHGLQTTLGKAHDLAVLMGLLGKHRRIQREQSAWAKASSRQALPALDRTLHQLEARPRGIRA